MLIWRWSSSSCMMNIVLINMVSLLLHNTNHHTFFSLSSFFSHHPFVIISRSPPSLLSSSFLSLSLFQLSIFIFIMISVTSLFPYHGLKDFKLKCVGNTFLTFPLSSLLMSHFFLSHLCITSLSIPLMYHFSLSLYPTYVSLLTRVPLSFSTYFDDSLKSWLNAELSK